MGFFKSGWGKKNADNTDDALFLTAEPISRKQMDLLWLDPPHLNQLTELAAKHKTVTVTLGDSTHLRDHVITPDDCEWAKKIEKIVDKAFAASQNGNYKSSIKYYKEALILAPGCDLFLMSVGAGYAQLKQKEKAVGYLEKAAQISPDNARILENLNNAYKL